MGRDRFSLSRALAGAVAAFVTLSAGPSSANPTGTCDVSPGDYTAWTGTSAELETASVFSPGVSEARCLKDILSLGGSVVEGVFRDAKGNYANELTNFGKLVNMWPGESANSVCNGFIPSGKRNAPGEYCIGTKYTPKTFADTAASVNALDWKYAKPVRFNPSSRLPCPPAWPPMGCFGDRCYDADCVKPDGTLVTCAGGRICKKGACVLESPSTLPLCSAIPNVGATGIVVEDGQTSYYEPWNAQVFDLGGLANKVAIFAVNAQGPQPCEGIDYTVYLTNNPASREVIDDPSSVGPDRNKWNRARLFKLYTHGWIDNPDCCADPRSCDPTKCTLPKPGDKPVFEADSMALVYSLPCGIAFRYAAVIAGYDGKSLGDPAKGADRCAYHSHDAEIDAVAGLSDDETAICPDKDGDGFPTCDCPTKPTPCDCVDDPEKNPEAKKYYPGAPQACDGPQYSCAPSVCPFGTSCVNSQCLRPCDTGEFKCPGGFTCQSVTPDGGAPTNVCVPAPCGDAGICPAGRECKAGTCVDLCASAKCPPGQICQGGKCLDPCGLVKCPVGETCYNGKCVLPCACLKETAIGFPCIEPTPKCKKDTSTCVANGCESMTCPKGQVCVGTEAGPKCKAPCDGVVCPGKQVCDPVKGCVDKCELLETPCPSGTICQSGLCLEPECANVECTAPFVCRGGMCVEADAGVSFDSGPTDTGVEPEPDDATIVDGGTKPPPPKVAEESGCGCTTPGARATGTTFALAGLLFAGAVVARRRRRP